MTDGDAGRVTKKEGKNVRHRSRLTRWLVWIGASLCVLALAAVTVVSVMLHRAEPMIRASLIDTLQKRFHARVELDDLRVSILDGFWVEARGLRIWLPPDVQNGVTTGTDADISWRTQPWITAGNMRFHASWRILPGKPIIVSVIHVQDVRVQLPPKEDRPHLSLSGGQAKPNDQGNAEPSQATGQTAQSTTEPQSTWTPKFFKLPSIQIRRIECESAELVIERKQDPTKPPKLPLNFDLRKIILTPDGHGGPVAFVVDMINAKPVGIIHSTGHFGPWVSHDPGALPVEGNYTFDHVDLSTIKGIAGILSSTGKYSGTLRRIETEGQTQTPDFRLERVDKGSGVLLTTHFHAIVDGTNGDTYLQPVDAMLGQTHIVAKGQVVRASDLVAGAQGHDITLQVVIDRGRIEDILDISANSEQPFMTGNLTLDTSFHLPPGKESVWEKLQLNGKFHLSDSRFSSDKMQGRIVELSLRGQGRPKDAKDINPDSVVSEMQGHFKLDDGNLQLPDLQYRVPGAEIVAHGTYGLKPGTLAFEGDARLDASISQIVGGWKGLLLKPADRFLRKNGAGTDVPIHVDGTRKEPKFGVDFDRLGKNDGSAKEGKPETEQQR
jgi:hypothetical protein